MKKLLASIVPLAMAAMIGVVPAFAAEDETGTPHYPINHLKEVDWSFAGPFGTYDKGQLQRGLKVYAEVCAACHSMDLVAFRTLEDLGYSEDQLKSFAANYEVEDGPNGDGEMFTRAAVPSDYFPSPFPNTEAAAYAHRRISRFWPRLVMSNAVSRSSSSTSSPATTKADRITSIRC